MRLEELVDKNYNLLSDNDVHIWKYISSYKKECEHLPIEQLAKKTHVSRTTIMRFAQKLGLKGYSELKVYLKIDNTTNQHKQTGTEYTYQCYLNYMNQIKESNLNNIIELIRNAKNIYACSTGIIQHNVVSELKRSFLIIGKLIYSIRTMNETYAYEEIITNQDVVFMVSHSGENKYIVNFTKKLKAKNVTIISITAKKNNTLSQLADIPLYVDIPNIYNPLGPRHEGLVNYFILIDFILAKYIDYHKRRIQSDT